MDLPLDNIKSLIKSKLEAVPETLRQDDSSRHIIINCFYNMLEEKGVMVLPAWKPPRSTRDRLDLVAVEPSTEDGIPRIKVAVVASPLVELPMVKSLEWVECENKIYVTFSQRTDKVKPTTLFLKEDHIHLDIFS